MENQVKLCSSGDTTAVILIKTTPDLTRHDYTKRAFTGDRRHEEIECETGSMDEHMIRAGFTSYRDTG